MSTEWDGKPPHERAEEWRERLVLALGREQGLRLALAEREAEITRLHSAIELLSENKSK